MLENLFNQKSNEELRIKVKQWNVFGFTFVAMLAIASLTFAFKLPELAALLLTSAMFLLVMPMIIMCILMANHFTTTLQMQIMSRELKSELEWRQMNVNRCVVQAEHNVIEEIRTQAFKDGKKVVLRSKR